MKSSLTVNMSNVWAEIADYEINTELECPICLDNNGNTIIKTECCNNQFHEKCITEWLKRKKICPICRNTISIMPNVIKQLLQ